MLNVSLRGLPMIPVLDSGDRTNHPAAAWPSQDARAGVKRGRHQA